MVASCGKNKVTLRPLHWSLKAHVRQYLVEAAEETLCRFQLLLLKKTCDLFNVLVSSLHETGDLTVRQELLLVHTHMRITLLTHLLQELLLTDLLHSYFMNSPFKALLSELKRSSCLLVPLLLKRLVHKAEIAKEQAPSADGLLQFWALRQDFHHAVVTTVRVVAQTVHALPTAETGHFAAAGVHDMTSPCTAIVESVVVSAATIATTGTLLLRLLLRCQEELTGAFTVHAIATIFHCLMLQPLEKLSKGRLVNIQTTIAARSLNLIESQMLLANELLFGRFDENFRHQECKL